MLLVENMPWKSLCIVQVPAPAQHQHSHWWSTAFPVWPQRQPCNPPGHRRVVGVKRDLISRDVSEWQLHFIPWLTVYIDHYGRSRNRGVCVCVSVFSSNTCVDVNSCTTPTGGGTQARSIIDPSQTAMCEIRLHHSQAFGPHCISHKFHPKHQLWTNTDMHIFTQNNIHIHISKFLSKLFLFYPKLHKLNLKSKPVCEKWIKLRILLTRYIFRYIWYNP